MTEDEYVKALSKQLGKYARLEERYRRLLELVRCLVYATNPLDRAKLIENAVEMGIEVDA